MTFTYSGTLSNPLDYVRFRLDDKVEEYAEYSDEELNYFIDKISGTPTENDLDKVALRLLRQQLQELMRAPSRERAGQVEVYKTSASSLQAAIKELEADIRRASPVKPYFGGVDKTDYITNRKDDSILQGKFYDGAVYQNSNEIHEDDFNNGIL